MEAVLRAYVRKNELLLEIAAGATKDAALSEETDCLLLSALRSLYRRHPIEQHEEHVPLRHFGFGVQRTHDVRVRTVKQPIHRKIERAIRSVNKRHGWK